jgi:hypothetical protein
MVETAQLDRDVLPLRPKATGPKQLLTVYRLACADHHMSEDFRHLRPKPHVGPQGTAPLTGCTHTTSTVIIAKADRARPMYSHD